MVPPLPVLAKFVISSIKVVLHGTDDDGLSVESGQGRAPTTREHHNECPANVRFETDPADGRVHVAGIHVLKDVQIKYLFDCGPIPIYA